MKLNDFSNIDSKIVAEAANEYGTPLYLYDEAHILKRCRDCVEMENAFGLTARYAMKANSNKTVLKIINDAGLHLDASSLNEVIRAKIAGVPYEHIMLTTQEVYTGDEMAKLEEMMLKGLRYNACSIRQLELISEFAAKNQINPGIRIHPGIGSGESATRNTGDDYSCFGIHLSVIDKAIALVAEKGISFEHIHVHIGSGADSDIWRQNIDLELEIIEEYFPDAVSVSFGGGLKEARMPDEESADLEVLARYAKERIEAFYEKTGRKLHMEIEPGTYIAANSGYAVTRVIDKKSTSRSNFIIADGGMELNSRPLLYGSRHPFYNVTADGTEVLSSEFHEMPDNGYTAVVAGKCCESGDSQTLAPDGHSIPRRMSEPSIGDLTVIGGVGAYCSSMSPFNYNSHEQAPEVLYKSDGSMQQIRKRQTLEQMLENEI